ncbi:MAG: 3-deoxy-manno-octulosonate cytidylyltransferase [Alphaproteobacteria bacterium]
MENLIIIPARLESSRLPNKPLAEIANLPMIVHVMNRAVESKCGDVIVATPNQEIFDIISTHNGIAVMTKFSHESGSDRIFEALEKYDQEEKYEKIINLQGDLPAINPSLINQTFNLLEENLDADISTLCSPIFDNKEFENPNIVKAYIKNPSKPTYADDFVRMPGSYNYDKLYHHLGIYGYKRSSLKKFISTNQSAREKDYKLEQLRALDNDMKIVIDFIKDIPIGVDTEDDLYNVRKELE